MREPDTEAFYAEAIDDALGDGIRIYDASDTVHELRETPVATRIYEDEGRWQVKARLPTAGEKEAYQTLRDAAHRVGDAYDWDVTVPAYDFRDGDHTVTLDPAPLDGELAYNEEDGTDIDIPLPESRWHWAAGTAGSFLTYDGGGAGLGAILGGVVGTAAGTPMLGAMAGSGVGGGIGTLLWGAETTFTWLDDESYGRNTAWWKEKVRNSHGRRKREAFEQAEPLHDGRVLSRINDRNSLEAEIDHIEDYDMAERYEELDADDQTELFEQTMRYHFDQFHRRHGVTLDASVDTYTEARRLAAAVTDTADPGAENPSIYQDRDAFRTLFEALPGRDRDVLVENALEQGATDAVRRFLDREHQDRVQQVGGRTRLEAGEAGMEEGEP